MIKMIPYEEYKQLWEKAKGNLRIEVLERYLGESDKSYKARLHKHLNPDMPRELNWWTHEGLIIYRPIKSIATS